jgi:hypothetical protein
VYSYGRETRLLPRCKCGRACPVGKRKCLNCLSTKGYKVTKGRDSRKGANAVGLAVHRPEKSRVKVKKYHESFIPPHLTAYSPPERGERKPLL